MWSATVQPLLLNGLLVAAAFTFLALFAVPPMLHQARKRQRVVTAGVAPAVPADLEQHGRHEAPPLVAMDDPMNWPAGGHRPHGQLYRDPYAGNVNEPHDPWRALYSSMAARGQRRPEQEPGQDGYPGPPDEAQPEAPPEVPQAPTVAPS